MHAIIAANPDILVLPRFGLEPPPEWREQHPDELMVHYKIGTGEKVLNHRVAVTSLAWRRWAGIACVAAGLFLLAYGNR